jgi:crotonobetainyl-CoA:carnitine CoA-transferase CaiB-like acyl-CoA transferase
VLTGLHATVGILAALHHRDQTGTGQHLQISLLGALLSSLVNQSSAYIGAGEIPTMLGNAHPSIAPYEVYATADRPLVIAVGNDEQFRRLVEALGASELADSDSYQTNTARVAHRQALKDDLEALLTTQGADHWQRALTEVGVPCGPINDIAQSFALASELGLAPTVTIEDQGRAVAQVANPVTYSQTPARYVSAPPAVDEDREAVLRLLHS